MEYTGCRLCLKMINNNFVLLEAAHQNMLQVVIPVINWNDICGQPKLCQDCSENLHITYLFKNSCLDNNKRVEKLTNSEGILQDRTKTCGLCCQANIFEDLKVGVIVNLKVAMHKCFPQMKIPSGDLSICEKCSNSLKCLDSFINLCLETQQYIKIYCSAKGINCQDECIKNKNFSSSSSDKDMSTFEVTKTTILENNSDIETTQGLNRHTFSQKEVEVQDQKDCKPINLERINVPQEKVDAQDIINSKKNVISQIELIESSSNQRNKLETKDIQYVNEFHCDKCDYVGKYKSALISHLMRHKDPSKTKMHKCEVCGHETKRLGDLKWHMIIHKDPEEVKWYKCADCSYETKRKGDLKQHVVVHNSCMFKCNYCPFETKNELYLNTTHMLLHKDISEIRTFKCESCPYIAKRKLLVKLHSRIHQSSTELEKYKCNWCDFETINKQGLKGHLLIHKCRSELKMYKCNYCEYEGTRKSHLRDHMLRHINPSGVTYDCSKCAYKAKRKGYLRKHMATHKDPSELIMYKCVLCAYQSKRKGNLKSHMYCHIRTLKTAKNSQEEIDKIMLLIRNMSKT